MKYIYLIIFTLILASCEETVEGDLPFREQVVISSVLTAGKNITSPGINTSSFVHLGKTVHPLEYPDTNRSFLKEAKVTIKVDSDIYELTYFKNGYWINNELIPEEGKNYRIEVEYKGKITSAETFIPVYDIEKGPITKEIKEVNDWFGEKYYQINLKQKIKVNSNDFAFFVSQLYLFDEQSELYNRYIDGPLYNENNTNGEFETTIYSLSLSDLSDTLFLKDLKLLSYDLFDPAVEIFWDSQYEGNEESGIFGGGGLNRNGNIKNGIGFFYGNSFRVEKVEIEF